MPRGGSSRGRGGSSGGPSHVFGNWGHVNIFLNNLTRAKNKEAVLERIGELIVQRIKQNIVQQSLPLTPLTEAYRQRKIAQGYDDTILIREGDYLDSIKITDIIPSGDTFTVVVGVEDGTTDSGLSMQELADYIEFGTSKMPGRFPFTLSWEEMRSRIKSETINQISVAVREDFR